MKDMNQNFTTLSELDVNTERGRARLWGAGVPIEVWSTGYKHWYVVTNIAQLSTHLGCKKFRIKPFETPKHTIEIPQCLSEAPAMRTTYWSIDTSYGMGYKSWRWDETQFDKNLLRNGQCFATEEDVKAVVAAMRGEK